MLLLSELLQSRRKDNKERMRRTRRKAPPSSVTTLKGEREKSRHGKLAFSSFPSTHPPENMRSQGDIGINCMLIGQAGERRVICSMQYIVRVLQRWSNVHIPRRIFEKKRKKKTTFNINLGFTIIEDYVVLAKISVAT